MAFTKIENSDFDNTGALSMPDRPSETKAAHTIKTLFDAPAREVIKPKFNDLIDELEATTAAAQIGAVAPPGARGNNVQAVLNSVFGAVSTAVVDVAEIKAELSSVVVRVEELEEEAHTHENKDLLDTYTQSDTDLADAVEKKHVHPNRSLLDTYEQTESDLADAVSKKHTHDNKSLLDTYEQTESDLSDAVSKKHTHSNKALLDTYTQTESDLASAVADDHTHSNKSVLDKFGESSGNPTYDGNPIGGGGGGTWGSITGTLSDQTDLQSALNLKANKTQLDKWTTEETVSNNQVTFNGLDADYGYKLYCEDPNASYWQVSTLTTPDDTIVLVFWMNTGANGKKCKLRILN